MAEAREYVRLSHAIFTIRALMNERAEDVVQRKTVRTTDAELLAFIKMWLWQANGGTDTAAFDSLQAGVSIEEAVENLQLPNEEPVSTDATITDTTYPLLPLRASGMWRMVSGVYTMFNLRNTLQTRPDVAAASQLLANPEG